VKSIQVYYLLRVCVVFINIPVFNCNVPTVTI